jgi:hypothetical protein
MKAQNGSFCILSGLSGTSKSPGTFLEEVLGTFHLVEHLEDREYSHYHHSLEDISREDSHSIQHTGLFVNSHYLQIFRVRVIFLHGAGKAEPL